MAIVADASGNAPASMAGVATDNKLSEPNRSNNGTPIAALTPQYPGELVLDTSNLQVWRAFGTTNTDWMPVVGVG
jgi:hypothetical protein